MEGQDGLIYMAMTFFVSSDKEKDLLNHVCRKKGVSRDIKGKLIASYLADE